MRVEIVRRGGIAGVALRGSLDTIELPSPTRERVERALLQLPFDSPSPEPAHPDSFDYHITVHDAAQHRAAHLDESQVPLELVPTINRVLKLGATGLSG